MDTVLEENGIPWVNCVGVSVDNTSVNLGRNNSLFTRIRDKNPATYFMGCPCHIVHNTCLKASESFREVTTSHFLHFNSIDIRSLDLMFKI